MDSGETLEGLMICILYQGLSQYGNQIVRLYIMVLPPPSALNISGQLAEDRQGNNYTSLFPKLLHILRSNVELTSLTTVSAALLHLYQANTTRNLISSYLPTYTSSERKQTAITMADSVDIYHQHPLHLDPTSKAISLPQEYSSTPQATEINTELQALNQLHRSLLSLDPPNIPPPPLPINPKRSAQITKLRDSANTAYRKANYTEAVRLYSYAIDMALGRPGWEPATLARDELSGLYANRAQAQMAQQKWPEGLVDAKSSVDCKGVGNVKAWWRGGKCLAEMGRWEEARKIVDRGLEVEGRSGEGGKELLGLLEEVEMGSKRSA